MATYISRYGTKVNTSGISGAPLRRIQQLADSRYGSKAQAMASRIRGRAAPKPVATPTTGGPLTQAPTNTPPVSFPSLTNPAPAPQTPMATPEQSATLFPSTRMFEPQNYGGSPLYKFQLQEGQKQLGRSLAARGLTNSGKAIEEELNLPLRVAAQDTDRMTRIASENADRLKSFQDNEALRRERVGNAQWGRLVDLATLMSQQSPWAGALAGLNNTADITQQAGTAQANYLRDAYNRVVPSGGGGGGGGGGAPFVPLQAPSGPNYSNITPAQIQGEFSSNSGWTNLLTKALANLF